MNWQTQTMEVKQQRQVFWQLGHLFVSSLNCVKGCKEFCAISELDSQQYIAGNQKELLEELMKTIATGHLYAQNNLEGEKPQTSLLLYLLGGPCTRTSKCQKFSIYLLIAQRYEC